MKNAVIIFFLFVLFGCRSNGQETTDLELQRSFYAHISSEIHHSFINAEANFSQSVGEMYRLSIKYPSVKSKYDTLISVQKALRQFKQDAFELQAALIQAACNFAQPRVADTIRISAINNLFATKELSPVLFGATVADSVSCGVMKLHNDLKQIETAVGTVRFLSDYKHSFYVELNLPAMKWGRQVFDRQPLVNALISIQTLEAKVYSALALCSQYYASECRLQNEH